MFPALYYEGFLPKHFTIFGYARSKMTDAELRTMVSKTPTCRIDQRENCSEKMDEFLQRCFYHPGQYDSPENFSRSMRAEGYVKQRQYNPSSGMYSLDVVQISR